MPDSKGKPASIRAKLKFSTVEMFMDRYSPNISKAGIFIKTPKPKPVGTDVRFEFQIADDTVVMRGSGVVSWIRETADDDKPQGMGIKFVKLDSRSKDILDRIVMAKKSRSSATSSRYSDAPPPLPDEEMAEEEIQPETVEPEAEAKAEAEDESSDESPGGHKRRSRGSRKGGLDMGAIDSLLADISSDSSPRRKRRKRSRSAEAVVEVAKPEPAPEPAPEPQPEPEPEPAPDVEDSVDQEIEDALSGLEPMQTIPPPEPEVEEEPEPEEEGEDLEAEEEDLELEPAPDDEGSRKEAISRLIEEEIDGGNLIDLLEPEEDHAVKFALSEPPGDPLDMDDQAPLSTISFMPPPNDQGESLDDQLESVLDADNSGLLNIDTPTGLTNLADITPDQEYEEDDDDEISDLGEDMILGEISDSDDLIELESETGLIDDDTLEMDPEMRIDPVDSLIAEITMDSAPPPPVIQLLKTDEVSDALDDIFTGEGRGERDLRESQDPPETLPDDAVPPGLVRERPGQKARRQEDIYSTGGKEPTGANVPVPPSDAPADDDDDDGKQKKGFFKKLFGG